MQDIKARLLLEHHGLLLELEWKFEILLAEILFISMRKFDKGRDEVMSSTKHGLSPVCVFSSVLWTRLIQQLDLLSLAEQDMTMYLHHIFFG